MTRWDVAAELGADLGEGPAWDAARGVLWSVDITPGTVHRFDPATGVSDARVLAGSVSAVIPDLTGGLVLATVDGVRTWAWEADEPCLVVPVEPDDPAVRMNDAKCDPLGRLWAGTMAYDFSPGASTLFRFGDGAAEPVLPGCTIANGLGWSPDGSLLYFIDTPTGRIDVLDYDLADGTAAGRRPWAAVEDGAGSPDGLAVDAEGGVWVALWGGSRIRRYDASGHLSQEVVLPVTQVTSVCFGGEGLDRLFVTSARYELGPADLADQRLAGALFSVDVGVAGGPTVAVDLARLLPVP